MSVNELKVLHDRATRGETLSADEQMRLAAWYDAEDKLERDALGQNPVSDFADDLRKKTGEALARLSVAVEQTQRLTAQNEVLRQENNRLRQQLAQPPMPQVA